MSKEGKRDRWSKIEVISRILSAIAVPFVLAGAGYFIQASISRRNVDQQYVALAIDILTLPQDDVDAELRNWAVDVLQDRSPVPLSRDAEVALKGGDLFFPSFFPGETAVSDWWDVLGQSGCSNPPEIAVSFEPPPPSPVGTAVLVHYETSWPDCGHQAALFIDGELVDSTFDLLSSDWQLEHTWRTEGEAEGAHSVRVQVDTFGLTAVPVYSEEETYTLR